MVVEAQVVQQQGESQDIPVKHDAPTLHALIDNFLDHAGKVALVSFTKKACNTLTFDAFVDEIKSVASSLKSQGITKGDNLAFFAPNSPDWIVCALGVIYSGATIVPIDSQQSDDVLVHILKDSEAGWIFTDERGSERLKKVLPKSESNFNHRIVRLDKEDIAESWKTLGKADCYRCGCVVLHVRNHWRPERRAA
jgi:long-subunit acyl-CoA synthetase (AMP-forming)